MPASTTITPYLTFAGKGDEAIEFYKKALGAEVEMLMRFNDSPDPAPEGMLQPGFEKKIMHAAIRIHGIQLFLTDGCDSNGKFDGFRLALHLPNEAEAKKAFDALAEGGSVMMPLTKTFWSPCFGMLADKFGLGWMVSIVA